MSDSPTSRSLAPLAWAEVMAARYTCRLGATVRYYPVLDSTNLLGRQLLREGEPDGTVVVTDDQPHGRGRLGRHWITPPNTGLTFSVLLHLAPAAAHEHIAMAVAVGVAEVIEANVGGRCTLKWPNDVLIDGAKTAGILTELERASLPVGGWNVVVGIGLNVNAAPDLPQVTSLATAIGRTLAREPLLLALLDALERVLAEVIHHPDAVRQRWRQRLSTLGQRVTVHTPTGLVTGEAIDVVADGTLLLRSDDGTVHHLRAGEVSLNPASITP